MGLDYTISLELLDKESGIKQFEETICYWRKCWNVSKTIHEMFTDNKNTVPDKYKYIDTEYTKINAPTIIGKVSSYIFKCVNNVSINDDLWKSDIWESVIVRDRTIRNMANLLALEEWLTNTENYEALNIACNDNSLSPMCTWYETFCKNPDKYVIVIESDFSY